MPASSLYCTQRSVSRISAAAANRSNAASPFVICPLCLFPLSSSANNGALSARSPAPPAATPAAVSPFLRNERRLMAAFILLHTYSIGGSPDTRSVGPSLPTCVISRSTLCHPIVDSGNEQEATGRSVKIWKIHAKLRLPNPGLAAYYSL